MGFLRKNEKNGAFSGEKAQMPNVLYGNGEKNSQGNQVKNGFSALKEVIKSEDVKKAYTIFKKYKDGKAVLEKKIIENEKWYRLRHWDCIDHTGANGDDLQSTSAHLFNAIINKHADAMDNYPEPNILPREEGDEAEARSLSKIIPVILENNNFEKEYSDAWYRKLICGTGAYEVIWDGDKLSGLGDVSVKQVDVLNLFWQPGICDIQQSKHLFHVELCDNDTLTELYPQLEGKLGGDTDDVAHYTYDDEVDTTDKSLVFDWYYKKKNGTKTVLHYCKFVGETVLYATENDTERKSVKSFETTLDPITGAPVLNEVLTQIPSPSETGWYTDGLFPFVLDVQFPVPGSPCGFGYIDVGRSDQEFIDRGGSAILENLLWGATPRQFSRTGAGINEDEYNDISKRIIHYTGDSSGIVPVQINQLPGIYVSVIENRIQELKETIGNRDVSNGGGASGVTAASAIAAMQEASSKLVRQDNKSAFLAFRQICYMIIERIRQFYDMERSFRIAGEGGGAEYIKYSNKNLAGGQDGIEAGKGDVTASIRLPLFDIKVSAQKQSPYTKMAQNELALGFLRDGFFNPQMADQALLCLDMMDFDGKDGIIAKIREAKADYDANMLSQIAAQAGGGIPSTSAGQSLGSVEGEITGDESSVTRNARAEAAARSDPGAV